MTSRRGLQAAVVVFGVVAVVFGAVAVVTGAEGVRHGGEVTANVDSEFRFFAAWYLGAGVLLLSIAPRVEKARSVIRGVCGVMLLAACGRLLSLATAGRPDAFFLVLLGIELAVPALLVPWQSAVAWRERT
jgi:hypothetical protein